jgi:hypothetical protein
MGLRAQRPDREYRHPTRTFPWWGWLGICSVILTWIFAWTRIPWFETYQPHTFTPLWLSFILVVNAWTYRRTGHCLLVDRPRYFLWLFPASAFFWWFFEFLNRFVQNWYYIGVEHFSPSAYFGYASFAFATVLPAVLSVRDALLSCPWIQERFSQMPSIPMTFTPGKGIAFLLFGAAGLFAAGAAPNYFFPLLWIAPLSVLLSMEIIGRQDGSLRQAIRGDWRDIVAAMLAALICGIFWEMWNYYSYAKWIYSIPWVHRFQIFEMPILGYAGNLPFGWVCLIIGNLINNIIPKR